MQYDVILDCVITAPDGIVQTLQNYETVHSIYHMKFQPIFEYFFIIYCTAHTVLYRYNAANFLQNTHKRTLHSSPVGASYGCLLWVQSLIYVLLLSLQYCVWYHVISDRRITAPDCIGRIIYHIHSHISSIYNNPQKAARCTKPHDWRQKLSYTNQI